MRPRELRRFISARRATERADVGPVERDIVDRARRQRRVVLEGSALQPESSIPRGDLRARGTHDAERDSEDSERSEEHTSELQSRSDLVCRLLLEKKKKKKYKSSGRIKTKHKSKRREIETTSVIEE